MIILEITPLEPKVNELVSFDISASVREDNNPISVYGMVFSTDEVINASQYSKTFTESDIYYVDISLYSELGATETERKVFIIHTEDIADYPATPPYTGNGVIGVMQSNIVSQDYLIAQFSFNYAQAFTFPSIPSQQFKIRMKNNSDTDPVEIKLISSESYLDKDSVARNDYKFKLEVNEALEMVGKFTGGEVVQIHPDFAIDCSVDLYGIKA